MLGTVIAAPANAAPSKNGELTLECDNGKSYTIVSPPGNGEFTPALATDGTVLIPFAFGEGTFTLTKDGIVVESGTQPATAKVPATRNPLPTSVCTYQGITSFTEDGSLFEATFSGSATAILVGRSR